MLDRDGLLRAVAANHGICPVGGSGSIRPTWAEHFGRERIKALLS